jgi:uncharacterized protein
MRKNVMQENQIIDAVSTWLRQVVIGLQLCPFAAKPMQENRVRYKVTDTNDDESLLDALKSECEFMTSVSAIEVETSLLIVANHLDDFWSYNQFLVWANQLIKREGYEGVFQLASFHPDYCFAGTDPEDAENLTNRSPYPILHIIREASLEKALEYFPDIDEVPEKNKQKMNALSSKQKQKLFPYLFN